MELRQSDGGGILGTPLEDISEKGRRIARIAAADKIAPTWSAYARMQRTKRVQTEHKLVNEANQEATNERDLHRKTDRLRNNSLQDLMDDEDRENLRLRKIKRASRAISSVKSKFADRASIGVDSLPFAAASADVPEVVPKPTNLSIGYQILRNENAKSRIYDEEKDTNEKQAEQMKKYVLKNRNDKIGLGFMYVDDNQNEIGKNTTSGKSTWPRLEEKASHRYLSVGIPITDDLEMSEMGNIGFENLDDAAEELQMKIAVQRQRRAETNRKRHRNPFTENNSTEQLFTEFSTIGILENTLGNMKEVNFSIPESFAKSPRHDFANDLFRSKSLLLPKRLQEEYNRVTSANNVIIRLQERVIENRLKEDTKRQQEELEKLTKFYGDELESKFVLSSSEAQRNGLVNSRGFQNSQDIGSSSTNGPTVGKSQRTWEPWVPASLLCRRFNLPEPFRNDKQLQLDTQNDASVHGKVAQEEEEESDFRLHAVVRADGTRINLEHGLNFAAEDDLAVLPLGNSNSPSNEVVARPSLALYRSIYGKANETTDYEEKRKSIQLSTDSGKNMNLPANKDESTGNTWSQSNVELTDVGDQKSKRIINQRKASDFF